MAYENNDQVYSQEKHADISQLKDEVDQIRLIMNKMRQSNNTDIPMYGQQKTGGDQRTNDMRSSLISLLSKNKGESKQKLDAETLKALLGGQGASSSEAGIDQFSPNLQMFESIISNLTGQQQTTKSVTKEPRFADVESMDGATNIVMGGNAAVNQPGNEFSFDKQVVGGDERRREMGAKKDEASGIRANSKGRQNAKARLAALKQTYNSNRLDDLFPVRDTEQF